MKRIILTLIAVIITTATVNSQNNNYDFWSVASNGDTLYCKITTDSTVTLTGYSPEPTGAFIVPDSVYYEAWNWSYKITAIEAAFTNRTGLTSVVIPEGMTKIGSNSFFECTNLVTINLPNSLREIGISAFEGCSSLLSITFPDSLKIIGNNAFRECVAIPYLSIPEGTTTIGTAAFYGCSNIQRIYIPKSVNAISYHAFSDCTRLKKISWHSNVNLNVNLLSNSIISGADSVSYLEIHGSISISLDNTFCSRIKTLILGDSVIGFEGYLQNIDTLVIGNNNATLNFNGNGYVYINPKYIFCNRNFMGSMGNVGVSSCDLTTLVIGDSVTVLSKMPMYLVSSSSYGFPKLRQLLIGNGITAIPSGMFYNCDSLRYVSIGSNVTSIGSTSFASCDSLKTIFIPNSTTIIEDEAFKECNNLTTITFGTSLNSIGNNAFYHCINLDTIYALSNSAPSLASNAFAVTRPNKKVVVPCNSNYDSVWGTTGFVYITGGFYLTLASNNDSWGSASFVQNVDCEQTAIIEAIPTIGHVFVQWSDGNTDNPRTITLSQNTALTAVFETFNVDVSVYSNNDLMGSVTGGGNHPINSVVTLTAVPACGYRFVRWNDSLTINPRVLTADKDTSFTAYFELSVDTLLVHDTTYIDVHDTTYVDVFVHDTSYVDVFIHDTAFINIHDTTYIDVFVHDTTTITDTITLTEYVPVHDTTFIPVHDTTYINVPVHDTAVVTDTVIVSVHDTTYITQTDTLTVTQYDTILIHDTIFIHDTVVVGVGDVETVNAKIYTNNRQIVVEGADGKDVWLYDVSGRILAIKQDYGVPIRFDAPASGTYMIKIGDYPARKVVVIK